MNIFRKGNQTAHVEFMSLDELTYDKRNPKDHDIGEIYTSIRRFGFISPVIINEATEQLVAGHGRCETLKGMKANNEPAPEGIKIKDGKWLLPVVRGFTFKDDKEALAFLIAENAITAKGNWNESMLSDSLKELLTGTDSQLEGVGFDEDDLDNMLQQLGDDIIEAQTVDNEGDDEMIECPNCHHKFKRGE